MMINMSTVRTVATLAFFGLALAMLAEPLPANASDTRVYATSVTARVRVATPLAEPTPDVNEPLDMTTASTVLTAQSESIEFSVPVDPAGQITLSGQDSEDLKVGLPDVELHDANLTVEGDGAVFADAASHVDVSVQAFEEGAQISTVIADSSAPTDYAYPVSVPAGGKISLVNGGAAVEDGVGDPVGFIGNPWAKDANGDDVPTSFSLAGDTLIQSVEHNSPGVQYPVVADPFLFKDLIKRARWQWQMRSGVNGAGWTLEVTPTQWARKQVYLAAGIPDPYSAGRWFAQTYYVGSLGYKELKKKYKSFGLNTNLGAMRDQYICHQQLVAVRAPNKATWNLDEWRKNVSYKMTLKTACNPPRGGPALYG